MTKKLRDADDLPKKNADKDNSTWTDAADNAQDSLNQNEAVSKKDSDDMNEHSAA